MLKYKYLILSFLLSLPTIGYAQENKLSITPVGRFYLEGAGYFKDDTRLSSGATMNDIRIGLKAKYGKLSAKIDMGFAKAKVSPKDIFLQYNVNDNSYLRAGHFAEPFGIDHMESSANIKFITANATSFAFSPGRNLGLEYIGWSSKLWYAGGLFADTNSMKGQNKGSTGLATTARIVYNPFTESGKIIHFGLAGTLRRADANGIEENRELDRNINYSSSILSNVDKTKAIDASISNANYQAKYAVELIGAVGSFALQGEYFHANVRRKDNLTSYIASGGYAQLAWLAIGGDYSYSKSWARLANPKAGSLEFVGRYNYTNLDRKKAAILGGTISDWSLAVNYYINRFTVVKLNYTGMKLGTNSVLANETVNLVQARLQFVF